MNQVWILALVSSLFACGNVNSQDSERAVGKQVYTTYCIACHGANGKLKLNDAPDLTVSKMTLEERIKNIFEGGTMMPAFAEVLSEEQIRSVAVYLQELKESN